MNPRFIALVALLLVFVTACDQSDISFGETTPRAAVTVTVALTASEVGAGTLQYWVDHPTELPNPITGTVGVSDPATTFTLTQLPAAPGYTLVMIAYKPNGGDPFCEGNANFDILDGQTTTVNTMLTCPTSDTLPNGEVGVDVTFQLNFCPVIEEILATPQITVVSTPVTIQSLATDPDNTAPVSYLWTASNGAIMDGTQPTTVYTCATVGDHTLTLNVSDGDTRCDQQRQVLISCTPNANCGNSIREVTEFCDDGVNDGGDLECLNCAEIQNLPRRNCRRNRALRRQRLERDLRYGLHYSAVRRRYAQCGGRGGLRRWRRDRALRFRLYRRDLRRRDAQRHCGRNFATRAGKPRPAAPTARRRAAAIRSSTSARANSAMTVARARPATPTALRRCAVIRRST